MAEYENDVFETEESGQRRIKPEKFVDGAAPKAKRKRWESGEEKHLDATEAKAFRLGLNEILEREGLSNKEAARKAGVSETQLASLRNGVNSSGKTDANGKRIPTVYVRKTCADVAKRLAANGFEDFRAASLDRRRREGRLNDPARAAKGERLDALLWTHETDAFRAGFRKRREELRLDHKQIATAYVKRDGTAGTLWNNVAAWESGPNIVRLKRKTAESLAATVGSTVDELIELGTAEAEEFIRVAKAEVESRESNRKSRAKSGKAPKKPVKGTMGKGIAELSAEAAKTAASTPLDSLIPQSEREAPKDPKSGEPYVAQIADMVAQLSMADRLAALSFVAGLLSESVKADA